MPHFWLAHLNHTISSVCCQSCKEGAPHNQNQSHLFGLLSSFKQTKVRGWLTSIAVYLLQVLSPSPLTSSRYLLHNKHFRQFNTWQVIWIWTKPNTIIINQSSRHLRSHHSNDRSLQIPVLLLARTRRRFNHHTANTTWSSVQMRRIVTASWIQQQLNKSLGGRVVRIVYKICIAMNCKKVKE